MGVHFCPECKKYYKCSPIECGYPFITICFFCINPHYLTIDKSDYYLTIPDAVLEVL